MKIFRNCFIFLFFIVSCSPKNQTLINNAPDQITISSENDRILTEKINKIIPQLSLDDKVNIVVGVGMNFGGFSQSEIKEKVPGAAGNTGTVAGLDIPSIVLTDGPAGVRISPTREEDENTYYCTAFPIATQLASTWDTDLVREIGMAMGEEVKEYGADILLGPGMNIHRNPLCGRNFEYFSEDPYLSGFMAASIVNGVESKGVGASIKHFAANNQETNRMMINTVVDERTMREIYLRGFEIAVKQAQPWTVMSSYNRINGTYASQNMELLETILRDEWGFKGLVVTDWFAGDDAVEQMKAGNDLIMPGTPDQKKVILAAVRAGELDEKILNKNVSRILKVVLQSRTAENYTYSNTPDLKKHADLARKAAAEGVVLLKNEGVLPLKPSGLKIAAFGNASYEFIAGGTGSGDVNEAYTISLVEGLENATLTVDEEIKSSYITFMEKAKANQPEKRFFFEPDTPIPHMPIANIDVEAKANDSDIALITIGRNSGEFSDRKLEGDFYLNEEEKKIINVVSKSYHAIGKKVVVLMNIGNVVETASWKEQVDAIVLGWQGGQEAGNALVDVLIGKVNPSGKLPTTFAINYEDYPSSSYFPGEEFPGGVEKKLGPITVGKDSEVKYKEGVFVGYRYFTTTGEETSFPFGYGMSYTDFDYRKLTLGNTVFNGELDVSLNIKNTGEVSGKEAVQLYISAPGNSMDKPTMELKDFGKTRLLKPGKSQTLKFVLNAKDLASFDKERSAWVVEKGEYMVMIGASSSDIKLKKAFTVPSEIIVEIVNKVLSPKSIKPASREEIGENQNYKVSENILWASPKGHDLTMDIYKPNTGKSSYPVLVMFHGGGWLINDNSIMNDASAFLATNGEYVICNVNYRLLVDLDNSVKMNEIVEDAFGAVLWVKANIGKFGGDPDRVIVTGDSAGGHLAMMVVGQGHQLVSTGFNGDNKGFNPVYLPEGKTAEQIADENGLAVQGAIISYGAFDIYESALNGGFEKPSNFFWMMGGATPRGLFGSEINVADNPEPYKVVSPIYNIPLAKSRSLPPLLFTVGSEDNLTTPVSIQNYIEKLKGAGHANIEYWTHEGRPHAFLDSGSNEFLGINFEKDAIPALKKMISFMDKVFYPVD